VIRRVLSVHTSTSKDRHTSAEGFTFDSGKSRVRVETYRRCRGVLTRRSALSNFAADVEDPRPFQSAFLPDAIDYPSQ